MSSKYFNRLNYTLANEDTSLELSLLSEGVTHLMSVAGSGGRVLPLLAKNPKNVTCVDLSREQLYLCELRIQSVRAFTHLEFLAFWGYPPGPAEPEERKKLFRKIEMSFDAKVFFENLFESLRWGTILYEGKWERTIGKLSRVNQKITGLRGVGLFSAMNRDEHKRYLRERFPKRAWSVTLMLLGNASVFNALLYKGSFPKKNIPKSSFQIYQGAFKKLFKQGPARENFFLQLLFFGKIIFAEGNPVECDPVVYRKAKSALKETQVTYLCGNIVEIAEKSELPIDLLSLSDVPSYFSGTQEKQFMQKIKSGMAPQGMVVVRNYLRVPQGTDLRGFKNSTKDYTDFIDRERVQMYSVDVFKRDSRHEGVQ